MQSFNKTLDDNVLIEQYLATQNQQYFSELYGRYANKIYTKCLGMLRESTLAEDAAQDIFMKIFLKIATFQNDSKFSTWVYTVTYNYCIDLIRKQKRGLLTVSSDDETTPQLANDIEETSDAEFLEMDYGKLTKALNQIPSDDKALLIMKYQDGMSIKELSIITGKTESAIKMKLKRAKYKVREKYDKILIIFFIIFSLWMKN